MKRLAPVLLSALLGLLLLPGSAGSQAGDARLSVTLRTRVAPFRGEDAWEEVRVRRDLPAPKTAAVLCDVWDRHWCAGATRRCGVLARRINSLVEDLRRRGVFIIHAPSDTMDFYRDTPQRKRMAGAPLLPFPTPRTILEPPLPIDDRDGGCDDEPQCATRKAWSRQDPAIRIAPEDGVSDNGQEVYTALRTRGIDHLLVMGVHTNMCVLGRSFAIRQMTRSGVRCILVRDLTDTMYNPRRPPMVPHDRGTELVIEHIEKYWCPTVESRDLTD